MRTLARSMGWITMEANVAAEPPQTKGSAILATEDFSDMVAGVYYFR